MADPQPLQQAMAAVVARDSLTGAPFREALATCLDQWLAGLMPAGPGYALVAVGGLARREPTPFTDLDLVLLHDGGRPDVDATAAAIWHAVWDGGVRLDHSVRTVDEALAVADTDLKAMLGLLQARHVAGDQVLTQDLIERVRRAWRSQARVRLPELVAAQRDRWRRHGDTAFLLEPQLKEGRGGLRDAQALQLAALSWSVDVPLRRIRRPYETLLDVRTELHRASGRAQDQLLLQDQAAVARRLGYADVDHMSRAVSGAARTVAFECDGVHRSVASFVQAATARAAAERPIPGPRGGATRRPLAHGVVEQAGEVVLARDSDPRSDPLLVLRVAAAAAAEGLPISPYTTDRLVRGADIPTPWPAAARSHLVSLLSAGSRAVPVIESLDQAGLMVRLIPEWEHVRCLPQRNPVHTYTVDRHLTEAAARAAELVHEVPRPDLLLVGALLHDIGKGHPGDHSEVGMAMVAGIATRLGFAVRDVDTLVQMVEHHLLLPDVATRRDPDDPATIQTVVSAVQASAELLDLLAALTVADSLATGPGAWSDWKAGLVRTLVRRTKAHLAGEPAPKVPELSDAQLELVRQREVSVQVVGPEITVVAPDQPGLVSAAAGVLALHRLDVYDAVTKTRDGMAVVVFHAGPRYGTAPQPGLVRGDLIRVLHGDLPLRESIARREQAYRRDAEVRSQPRATWVDGQSTGASVLEVRCTDSLGLLHRVTGALESLGVDIAQARVSTHGTVAVDAFYVREADGGSIVDGERRRRIARAVLDVVAGAPPVQSAGR